MEIRYLIYFLCLLLVLLLLLKEFLRKDKSRLLWRLLATVSACFSLFFMVIPFSYTASPRENKNEIILLTPGVSRDTVSALKGELYTTDPVLLNTFRGKKPHFIADLSYFLNTHPEVRQVKVYGYGLKPEQQKGWGSTGLEFHPATGPSGLLSCSWNSFLKSPENLLIQGLYRNTSKRTVKLMLEGLGKKQDSIEVKALSDAAFTFSYRPVTEGLQVFKLLGLEGKDTISREDLPFQVKESVPLRILMLSSAPDFEDKFLKNWFYKNKYSVLYRSRISKDKYSTDFLNQQKSVAGRLNRPLLKKTDLLILDEEAFGAMSREEYTAVEKETAEGMGVLVRRSTAKAMSGFAGNFNLYESPVAADKLLKVTLSSSARIRNTLTVEQSLFLKAGADQEIIASDGKGRVLALRKIYGRGNVLLSVFPSSYHWLLSGQAADYGAFWSELLEKSARKNKQACNWKIFPYFPFKGEKTRLLSQIEEGGRQPEIKLEGNRLSPGQNSWLPFQWDVVFWPVHQGWTNMSIDGQAISFYVYPKGAWENVRSRERLEGTARFAEKRTVGKRSAGVSGARKAQLSLWWFFVAFLCSAGFLWYESRLPGSKIN